jgi:hypothetical protein
VTEPSQPFPAFTGRTVHTLDRSGSVRDWLVSPAWNRPCTDLGEVLQADGSPWGPDGRWVLTNGPDVAPLKARLYGLRPLVTDQPLPEVIEAGEVRWRSPWTAEADTGRWRRTHTDWDGLLDWSRFCHTPEYQQSLAATCLEVDQPEYRTLEVACTGPFALWIGDELVLTGADFGYMVPVRRRVDVRLPSGMTRVVLATWQVAFRECRHVAGLRVLGLPVRVVVPSPGADEYTAATAERVLDAVAAWPWALSDERLTLTGPVDTRLRVQVQGRPAQHVRLTDGKATLYLHGDVADDEGGAGSKSASMLVTGETSVEVSIDDPRAPVSRIFQAAQLPQDYRPAPSGEDPQEWGEELLRHAANGPAGVARALARLASDTAATVEADELANALDMVRRRGDCADFEALGLVQLWHRAGEQGWAPGQREEVRAALTGFKYWIDQPGLDAMCYFTENHQMVWHTAELLAGEALPEDKFANSGWSGRQHAEHGGEMAEAWMRRKLAGGFSEFDSNAYLAIDTLALTSIVELAEEPRLRQLAEALLDKMLLTLASNSFHGVHGAAHGRTYTTTLRSGRFEETAPIMRVLWGTGSLNSALLPAVVLAAAHRYRVPPLVRAVATQPGASWYGRQVYRGRLNGRLDLLERPYGSDLRVWRTADVMLSSVQDYRSGLPGLQEHAWGATLSPEAQIFATHPGAAVHGPSARPNAWAGQCVLPRVRQHRDTLLVLHRLPDDDPSARTHLWFPVPHLDEYRSVGPWLAGRVGKGYVGVATQQGLRPVESGDEAWQRWLPVGSGTAYVVTVGSHETDGDFDAFVAQLSESMPRFSSDAAGDPSVSWTTRDGERLELGWSTPFLVDRRCQDLDSDGRLQDPPHLDNPACTLQFDDDTLVAEWEGERLEIDLRAGMRCVPPSRAVAGARAW